MNRTFYHLNNNTIKFDYTKYNISDLIIPYKLFDELYFNIKKVNIVLELEYDENFINNINEIKNKYQNIKSLKINFNESKLDTDKLSINEYLKTSKYEIFIDKYYKFECIPYDDNISDILKSIFNTNNSDWLKNIVSLELLMKNNSNIKILNKTNNILEMCLLLSAKYSCPLLNDDIINNELIKFGLKYRQNINDTDGYKLRNCLVNPSIKTKSHMVRLNNCIMLERGNHGFILLSRHDTDHNLNDIYLDWDTQLFGVYKLINMPESEYKIIKSGRNKVLLGFNKIEKNKIYYFVKVSDDVGEYTLAEPTLLINKFDNIKKYNDNKNTKFSFTEYKYSKKYDNYGRKIEDKKPEPIEEFKCTELDFPTFGKKKNKK